MQINNEFLDLKNICNNSLYSEYNKLLISYINTLKDVYPFYDFSEILEILKKVSKNIDEYELKTIYFLNCSYNCIKDLNEIDNSKITIKKHDKINYTSFTVNLPVYWKRVETFVVNPKFSDKQFVNVLSENNEITIDIFQNLNLFYTISTDLIRNDFLNDRIIYNLTFKDNNFNINSEIYLKFKTLIIIQLLFPI